MAISCNRMAVQRCSASANIPLVEILGCGMVHPDLLRNFTIDPENTVDLPLVWCGAYYADPLPGNDLRLYSQNTFASCDSLRLILSVMSRDDDTSARDIFLTHTDSIIHSAADALHLHR